MCGAWLPTCVKPQHEDKWTLWRKDSCNDPMEKRKNGRINLVTEFGYGGENTC